MPVQNPFDLTGKLVLITGGGGGIGSAIADLLARCGAELILTDLSLESAQATASKIVAAGGKANAYEHYVEGLDASRTLAATIEKSHGDIYGLVNNAGVSLRETIGDSDFVEKWHETFRVNVDGPMFVFLAFLEQLRRTKGSVVNIISTTAIITGNGSTAYAASKGAAKQLTQSWAREFAPQGIRVNAVAPSLVISPLTEKKAREDPEWLARAVSRSPMKRPARMEEVAPPVAMLLSESSSFINGTTIVVDGGMWA